MTVKPPYRKFPLAASSVSLNTLANLIIGTFIGFAVTSQLLLWLKYNSPSACVSGQSERSKTQQWSVSGITSRKISSRFVASDQSPIQEGLLFTGVMTAQKYLESRATAIYETWGQSSPGGIMFFSSEGSESKQGLPLVALRSVDDSYPPQKKSFMMFKYMYDNLLDKYEWFMRCDDDVYVHTERLELFLRSINSSKPQFIGQAGLGNKKEFGQLNLDPNQNFCMGGPGILMSRKTLSLMGPHIKYCLEHLYSTHEDVEVGRCVHKFAGIPCTWSYEMQTIFHNHFGGEIDAEALPKKVLQKAITFHPIKRPQQMYKLHAILLGQKSAELRHQLIELERDANLMFSYQGDKCQLLNGEKCSNWNQNSIKHPLKQYQPLDLNDLQTWDFFSRNLYSDKASNPRRRVEVYNERAINEVIEDLMTMINRYSKQRGRVIEFRDIMYGYMRYTPTIGVDYVLDLLLSYRRFRGRRMSLPVRRHAYLRQSFGELMVRELPQEELVLKKVHFIVPLSGRLSTFKRFLTHYYDNCVDKGYDTALAVIYFKDDAAAEENPKSVIDEFATTHSKITTDQVNIVEASGKFSRAQALEIGSKLFSLDSLLFFVDVDMVFDDGLVQRISWNTQQGKMVYFPIVYSQYDPSRVDPNDPSPDEHGYWRMFGFGIVSIYHSDLRMVGGMDTTIEGWGKEDVDLFDKIVASNLTVFRAPDPGLVHVYHNISCSPTLSKTQAEMCRGTKLTSTASWKDLAEQVQKRFPELLKGE